MRIPAYPFMVIAAVGFVLSFTVHIYAVLGLPSPLGSAAWLLHIGIFIVWLPAIFLSQHLLHGQDRKDFWKVALRGCPAWMRVLSSVIGVYAVANFLYFMSVAPAKHAPNTATPISVFRGFSGHWMIFYFMAFSILYSWQHINSIEE